MNYPYAIHVGGKVEEIQRVLTALFKHGYVFDTNKRYRNFWDVIRRWPNTDKWNYIVIGNHEECKAIMDAHRDVWCEETRITLENFLKLI